MIARALEMYRFEHGVYPAPAGGYGNWSGHAPNFGNYDDYIPDLTPTYIKKLPTDPKYDTGDQGYRYISDGNHIL